jgi:hypothetical protein
MTDDDRARPGPRGARTITLISRRAVLGSGAVILGGAAVAACATSEEEPGPRERRISKSEAGYQSSPHDGARCGKCENFLPPIDCKVVRGVVQPWGYCHRFEAKT